MFCKQEDIVKVGVKQALTSRKSTDAINTVYDFARFSRHFFMLGSSKLPLFAHRLNIPTMLCLFSERNVLV